MVLKKQNRYARVRLPSKTAYELSNGQNLPMVELWELVFSKLHIWVVLLVTHGETAHRLAKI